MCKNRLVTFQLYGLSTLPRFTSLPAKKSIYVELERKERRKGERKRVKYCRRKKGGKEERIGGRGNGKE